MGIKDVNTNIKEIINTDKAPAPVGPYSQAVRKGDFLFCSGQIPIIPETGEIISGDATKETVQIMKNIEAVLSEASMNFDNVIKTTIYLTQMSDFPLVNEVYASYFKQEPPARSCVAVRELPKGVTVEIEVLASI